MKVTPLILSFLLISATHLRAQYYFYDNDHYDKPFLFEIGGSLGIMNCLSDLGGHKGIGKKLIKDINLQHSQLCGSIFLSGTYQDIIALHLEGTFGQVKACDSILKSVASSTYGRYERNLSFSSPVSEILLAAEIYPLSIFHKAGDEKDAPQLYPYILAGIGFYHFNPQARLINNRIDLQPLHTEGEGFSEYPGRQNYKLNQFNIPLGVGIKYELSGTLNIRAEFVYRILQTDYLDDVSQTDYIDPSLFAKYLSGLNLKNALLLYDRRAELHPGTLGPAQRGNPGNNDAYFTCNLKIGLVLGRQPVRAKKK